MVSMVLCVLSDTNTTSFDALSTTTDTDSTSRTIPGPGALSGKAVLALGKATLHGAEVIIIRRRVQVISSKFPHKDEDNVKGIESMYEDILELSRRDLYSDVIRTRALHVILVQIGSGHVKKLVQCLATWHKVELLIFLSELIESFDSLWLANVFKVGGPPSLVKAYQSSLVSDCKHGLQPFVSFLYRLIIARDYVATVFFEAGIVKFLVHAYISDFSDPLAPGEQVLDTRLEFRTACNSLLDAFLKTRKGPTLFAKDPFHVLWPMQPGPLLYRKIPVRSAQRAELWRSLEAGIIDSRVRSISDVMLSENYRGILDQDSLDDISSDILEFSRDNIYCEAVTNQIVEMNLTLIGSGRTKKLVSCVSNWPIADIQIFVSKLLNTFDPLRLSVGTTGGNFSSSISAYHRSFASAGVDYPLQPVVAFIDHLTQASGIASEAALRSGFSGPHEDDIFRGGPALRATCESVLRTCSEYFSHTMTTKKRWLILSGKYFSESQSQGWCSRLTNTRKVRRSLNLGNPPGDSIDAGENCTLESMLIFLQRLVRGLDCRSGSQTILEGGVLELLLYLYLEDFRDPLSTSPDHGRLNLRAACDSLLNAFFKTGQGFTLIGEHKICVLWPVAPTPQLDNAISNQSFGHEEIWRIRDPEQILTKLDTVLNNIRREWRNKRRDLPEFDPSGNIAASMLEFLGYTHQYPDTIKHRALSIILELVGTGRTEELIADLETWPRSRVSTRKKDGGTSDLGAGVLRLPQ
ncbi:hypothetical protein BDZ94DRAFT_1239966 [Collybia nuda]|uniref:Uncharacterized protein n=1 Tax=Collybia nuda TaxID=64659 RepID=A0A9P5XZE2_9AGAR|nr:hypothetical protein BDZ94DRAFT_1239966 [Collybia nuda]